MQERGSEKRISRHRGGRIHMPAAIRSKRPALRPGIREANSVMTPSTRLCPILSRTRPRHLHRLAGQFSGPVVVVGERRLVGVPDANGSRTLEASRGLPSGATQEQERQRKGESQRVLHDSCPDGSGESTARRGVGATFVVALLGITLSRRPSSAPVPVINPSPERGHPHTRGASAVRYKPVDAVAREIGWGHGVGMWGRFDSPWRMKLARDLGLGLVD